MNKKQTSLSRTSVTFNKKKSYTLLHWVSVQYISQLVHSKHGKTEKKKYDSVEIKQKQFEFEYAATATEMHRKVHRVVGYSGAATQPPRWETMVKLKCIIEKTYSKSTTDHTDDKFLDINYSGFRIEFINFTKKWTWVIHRIIRMICYRKE